MHLLTTNTGQKTLIPITLIIISSIKLFLNKNYMNFTVFEVNVSQKYSKT